jgi:hypothetical protein
MNMKSMNIGRCSYQIECGHKKSPQGTDLAGFVFEQLRASG